MPSHLATAIPAALALLLTAGCGPAPYVIGPDDPSSSEAPSPPPSRGAVVVIGQAAQAPEPPDRWIPDGYPRPNPFAEARTWVGDYDCPQGRTELALRIVDVRGKVVRAVFDFHHKPTDAAGQYLMVGAFDEDTGRVAFEPGPWIIHPDDYISVGMAGQVSRDGRRFVGRITHPACGAFRLRAAR